MPLSPPLCLEAYFQNTAVSGNDYTTTLTVSPQTYQSGGAQASYTGSNVAVGMYATSSLYGYVFRIKSITSQTSTSVVAVLEDLNGTNKSIDPSGGIDGGGPLSGRGYIFELNEDGLPALTAINNAPTITFPDSILGRFSYDQKPALNERILVAVGIGNSNNNIATSQDGLNWIPRASGIFTSSCEGVAWNGSIWVAVGSGTNTIATSADGITWTGRTSPFTSAGYGIAWNGSLWVATGSGTHTLATSPDGITWTGRGSSVITSFALDVAWNGSYWVAVGSGTNSIATSADGINWVGRGVSPLSAVQAVAWNGSLWVAVGSGASHTIASSTDGVTWTGRGNAVLSVQGEGVAWNGSLWVAVGTGASHTIATSPDGITWTGRGRTVFNSTGYGIAWNGSIWVAVGSGSANTIATSTDGITWSGSGKNIFPTYGFNVASRRVLPYVGTVTTIPKTYPTLQVYARGAGNNNPMNRLVVLNGTVTVNTSTRGLTLTIINAIDLSVVSSTNYDTFGFLTDANNLGTAINNMTRQQIGILTSSDAWEGQAVNSTTLLSAAERVGLTKLGYYILGGSRRPYAAIFSGAGTDTTNVGTHDVIERMESDDADAPVAAVSAYIISDGTYASISGANSTNALYSANGSTKDPIVYVNSSGNMGVGTTATSLVSRLQVNDKVADDNTFNYGSAPLSVTIPTGTSTTVLNDQLPVAHFLRQGTSGQAYGARATMALSRYENSGVNSRTRLDFQLAHTIFDTVNVMSLRSDGRVGVGTTTPGYTLDVNGTQQITRPSANGTSVTNALVLFSGQSATNGGGAAIRFDHSTGALGQTRGAIINSLDDAGTFGQSVGLVFQTGQATLTERMRISGTGNVSIGPNTARTLLDVNTSSGDAAATIQCASESQDAILYLGTPNGATSAVKAAIIAEGRSDWSRSNLHFCLQNTASNTYPTANVTLADSKMVIQPSGNVGVGTVVPESVRLDVSGTISNRGGTTNTTAGFVRIQQGFSTEAGFMEFWGPGPSAARRGYIGAGSDSQIFLEANTGLDLVMLAGGAERIRALAAGGVTVTGTLTANTIRSAAATDLVFSPAGTEKIRATSGGLVGINTTPATGIQLDVNGVIRGSRSIVFTQTATYNMAPTFNSLSATTQTTLTSLAYTPKQSGTVTLIVEATIETFQTSKQGDDSFRMRIFDGTNELAANHYYTVSGSSDWYSDSYFQPMRWTGTVSAATTFSFQYICATGAVHNARRGVLTVYEISSTA